MAIGYYAVMSPLEKHWKQLGTRYFSSKNGLHTGDLNSMSKSGNTLHLHYVHKHVLHLDEMVKLFPKEIWKQSTRKQWVIIIPNWMWGIQVVWGITCATNIKRIQRFQSKTLRIVPSASRHVRYVNKHTGFGNSLVKPEVESSRARYLTKLKNYPNPLANALCNSSKNSPWRRRDVSGH